MGQKSAVTSSPRRDGLLGPGGGLGGGGVGGFRSEG